MAATGSSEPLKRFGTPVADLVGPMPFVALQQLFDATVPRGIHSYWKAEYVSEVSPMLIEKTMTQFASVTSPMTQLHIQTVDGATNRIVPEATAFGKRDAKYAVNIIGGWPEGSPDETHIGWVRETWKSIAGVSNGGAYPNFMDADEQVRVRPAYGNNYARLTEVKRKYDPNNIFRLNQNIQPTA